jgi:multidrug efflux pump subunit AcrB
VVVAVWSYGGLPPEEMEKRVVCNYERFLTTTVGDIEHIESQTLTGVAVVKIFFHRARPRRRSRDRQRPDREG